jgi:VIT1/CCC1 family predicted Fe2+/Mn2+ transporter
VAGASSFGLFAVGAIFPVVPLFVLSGDSALYACIALSGAALFLIGAGTSLFTGRGVLFSGMRQLLVGMAAAGVTFGLGRLIGVSISG